MKFYLPTKEECDKICEQTDAFYKTERVVEGQEVVMYDYRLASISDFREHNAFELRGITFVKNKDSWERNILMNKFFNAEQTEGWMLKDLEDKKIVRVQNKEDGSIISFVKFPNGKVRAKSKMSFESDQAVLAQKLYDENEEIQRFVRQCFFENKTPIFELVGYLNQIVLNYKVPAELILLQVRRNFDGSYVHKLSLDAYDIKVAEEYDLDMLESVAKSFSIEKATQKIGNRKFQSLQEMVDFLSN
jgi:T4 RnlA family RNA ligase